MSTRLTLAACLAGGALLAACGPSGPPAETAASGSSCEVYIKHENKGGVSRETISSADQEKGWTMPQGLKLSVTATREPDGLTFVARLVNDTAAPVDWVYLTGGEPGSTNPVNVQIAGLALRPKPPRPRAEVYPAPGKLRLDPGAEVKYTVHVCASDYQPPWPKAMKVAWSVEAWGASRVTGELAIQ